MKKLAIASALLSALAVATTANAYQAEVGASAGYVDPDHGSSGSEFNINGTYYFQDVKVRNNPLAEAAFLDKASNVSAFGNFAKRGDVNRDNTYGIAGEYFVPSSDFYVSGQVSRNELKHKQINEKLNTTYYGAEVGYLPVSGLLLAVGAKGYDSTNSNHVDPTIRAKYVGDLGNGQAFNLEGAAAFGDLDEYTVAADYYFNPTLGVGADYYHSNHDSVKAKEVGISARKFVTQDVSLEGRVGFGKVYNNDYTSYGVAAKYRF